MTDRSRCTFSLIRYVPDAVKNEFVNVGVLLQEADAPARAELRLTRDWARVRCVDPQADVAMLEALEGELRVRLRDGDGGADVLRLLGESLSNTVQMTEPKACLAETFQLQMDQLLRMYVETEKLPREQRRGGRAAIVAEMRQQFEREGVWELMRKRIAASQYTRAGDPLKIDCGYRPNGVIRMFHAVSLDGDVEGAKGLALSAPDLAAGVRRVEAATLELTAIVEPLRAAGDAELYRFGVETMERQAIRVMTVVDLERVAAAARMEMRLGE